ncbi:MAG: PKD domain-containing protein, partial [Bacteroidetes bacterium]|nr:PKD domain-containing protein [Bacteroidota bacterium]
MHSVRLDLFDNTGCSEGITKPVLVKSAPQVDFTYNWGCTSDTVKFTGQSSGAGGPAFWYWDFGDPPSGAANHAYIQNPSHVYNSPGLYHVTLKVTGANTCDNSATKSFYYDKSPNAAFNWSSPCFGSETHFTDQSYASTGLLIMWQWNFGDPNTGPMNTSSLQNPSHTFSAPGTYQVKLKVYDNGLCYDSLIREVVIFASPTAGFNVTEGCVGEFTEFHDISVDPGSLINHWHWDFGDGNTMSYGSFTDPVIHPYAVSGQYVVVLTVTDTNGCSNLYTKFVNVHPLPTVMFQFNPACANQTTYFTDFSSGSGSPVISWYWDFGDFTPTSTVQNPTHTYTTPGLYPVTLCVTNAANCSSCNTQTISVSPSPVADFTAEAVCKDSPTHFNNLSYCMGDNIVSWQWDFGDGSPTSNVQWPVHTFTSAGTFSVSLIVTSLHGCISTVVKPVIVHDRPVANFSWNQTGGQNCFTPGVSTQFTDLSTIVGGNLLSSWLWDFGDGNYGNTQNPVHQYSSTGVYYVTLTVFDINGCQNSIIKQVILAEKPIASFSHTITNCDEVCFTDASVGSGASIQSWFWDFGDPASGVQNFSTQQNPCHIYYTPVTQTYSIRLIVTNANGCSDTLDLPVTVSKPVPDFATVNQPCQGVATEFQDLSVSAGNFISAWIWDFGDPGSASNTSTDQNPIHIYTSVGTKYVTLTVTNGNGCTSNIGKPIEVSYPPQANWDFDRPNCFPNPTEFRDISMAQGSISIVSWDWNFGDGTPHSTLKDPVHSYLLEGTYPVTLTVVNANGCENYITKPFFNFRGPAAAFISDPVSKCIKEIVTFTDQSSPAFGNIVSWNWDFGDLSSHSTIQNPGHVYAAAGIFTVKLIVIDERGCADSVSQTITVNDLPATDFIADTACLGSETHFTNQTSGSNLSWLWNFGEPTSGVFNTSTLENPVHQYSSPGDYFVQLTVTNSNSCRKDTVKKITVVPLPMVNFSNSSPCSGEAVHFTDESTIYQGTVSEWKWNFGDGTGDFLGQNPTHTFINPGPYNVTLTITTTGNCPPTSATKQILIKSAPIADFAVSSLCVGQVQFNDMTNQNGGTSLISWDWNFGDPLSGPSNLSQLQNPIHIYTTPGSYLVSLIVANTDGCRDTLTSQVTVLPLPAVDFTAGLSCVSDTTCFVVNTVVTNIGAITAFAWDLNGDGSIESYDQNPCHVYPTSGTVNVTLTVTDTSGCKNSITHAINVKPPPIADFNTAGANCSNDSIRFINHSTCSSGYITQWIWNFGDGTSDVTVNFPANPNVAHLYNGLGPYTVKLTVESSLGCRNVKTQIITPAPSPLAIFNHSEPCLSQAVQFTDLSSPNGGGIISYWEWNFGDPASLANNTSLLQNPAHIFSALGNYQVKLTVTNSNGCKKDTTIGVTIKPLPGGDFSWQTSCVNQPVQFTVNPAVTNIPVLTAHHWDFGDGQTSDDLNPVHLYLNTGNFTVILTITDTSGCSSHISHVLNIEPQPTAFFSNPGTTCSNDSVAFTNLSTTTFGYIQKWEWDFGDGSPHEIVLFPNNPNVKKRYLLEGTYLVSLTVTNSHGCYHTYSHDVTVIPTPVANFHYADTCAKTLVHFTDASFPNGAGNNVSWTWDFGDPTSGIDNSSALQNPTHIFTAGNATYEVRLIVVNFNNCSDTIIKSVFIRPAPPVDFTFDPTCLNKLVDFTANLTIMLPATISSWDWDFGDGSAHSTNPGSASHLYLAAGVYQAVLTVVDTTGCSNSLTKTVYIVPAPIPAFTFTSATCDSMPVQFTDQSLIPAGFPGHITSWTWRWGDGSVTTISSPESPNVSHVFPGGVYHFNVWLTVTSSYGCIDSIGKPVTLIPKPTSAFEVSPGTPTCAAQSVQFNDLSAQNGGGIISLWSWNFGDAGSGVNNVSALQNPLHTFTGSGVYLVTLITRNLNNCADTVIKSITINQPPFANFSADTACAGNHMTFTDLSAANSGGGIISHLWNFGDGNTSTLVNPTNIYSAHGVYNVTLTVVNSNGCQHDTVKQVIVSPKPIPGFTSTSPACDSTFVHFTDQSVLPSGTLGFINKWIWTWGDGTSRTIISPESPNVSHLFPAGQYSFTVKLRVVTNSGCTDSISQPIQLIPRPVVSFEALPGSPACANQPVQFNDLSQTNGGGNIAGWLWNFGDPGSGSNNLSNLQNPTHNFATAATYNVALTVTNANGCSRSATLPVIVAVKPVANFIADTACAGGATQFTDASVSPGSLISSYAWNFGDGGSSNLQSPLHTFAAYGIYNVTLTVVNSNGCIHSVTKQVMVHPRPVPSFTVSQACCIGSPVTFTDHSFLPSGFSGYIKKWIWNFGDGTLPEVVTYPDPPNVTHTFAGASTSHNVRLTVISTSNCADSLEITVNSIPSPVANFSKPGATCLNQPVQFNDLSQTNGGGSIQTWSWNFGDPGSGANNFSTLQNPTHIFSTTMPYTVTLVVTSANGCSNTHDTVVTIHPLPVANFTNTSACQSYPVTFSDASTPAPAILSHSWNFGDGGVSTLASPQHIFTSYGNFLVTLTVTDTNGCIHSKSKTVTVNPKPVVDFSVAEVRCVGTPVSFTDNSFVPVGYSGTISGWLWNFDDGNTSTNPNPVHTFTGVGPSYNVKLRVTLTTGCIDSIVKPVNLIPSPIANFSHSSALCKNQPIQFTDLSLTNGGSALQNWSWNFGDPGSGTNNTSNLQNPTHIFASAGSYSVILMVENVNGCQKYDTVPVTINILPIAGFDASGSCQGNPFTFTNTSTANAASYTSSWNFGDGGTSVAQSPQHTYSAYGNYSVTLTIVNSNGCTHSVTTPVVVYPKPVAGFTFSPTSCAGSPVSFTDQSYMPTGFTGSISSWAWDFGDATTSTLPNPTHTYTGAATAYLVRLTVTSTHGCTGFIEKPVALIPAPVANFTHTGPLCANQPVQFTDLSQINGGTAIQSWSWNFDDPLSGANNTSTNQNPTHSFSGASDYHVILIVTNVNGCKDTLLPYPQISTTARPLAKFKADTACQGGYTHFTDSSTTISGTIVSHFWEFGDGTNSTAVNPSHLYATTGVFNVKLTVANSLGCQKDTIIPVTVLGKPIASFTYASPNCAGDSVQFNDFSTTPHGYIKKWVWNFGDGTPVVPIIFPQPQNIKHAFANGGTYNVTLTITTTDNCETQKVNTVQIGFRPYANFSFSANACPAQPVQFTDLSQLNGGPVLTNWNWNFGDPTTGVSNTSTAQNPTHIFSGSGAFIVHLIVTNSNGCVDSVLNGKTVTVNVAPVATFSADASCLGSPTQFTDASTPAGSIASWNWNFGDPGSGVNNASTLKDPVHIYNQLGTYTVTLQVINSSQCTHQTTMPVTVSPKPTSMFQYAVSCVDTNTQFTDLSIAPGSSIKTWKWDFGDGTPFVTIQNPIHVFTTAITHQVKLVVTNWAGCADSITLSVLTRPKPDAAFTYTSKFCKAGEVFFYDGSQGVGGAAINTRAWYFDTGGSVIFGIDPIHTFSPTNASYPVTLIVTDTYGCTDEIHDSLIFVKPGWGFTFTNNDTCQGYNTKFKPVNLAAGDSLRPVSWNFGDPNSFPNNTSSLYSPVHIFSGPGNFIVKMKAQNSDGCIDSIYREVHVDAAPNPQFNFVTATCDSVVYFTDSTLNPSTASITSWKWKWGDGTAPVIITPPLSGNTSHIYSAPGIYPATLIVTNINGCVDSITRSVQRFPCIKAGFTYADTLCARYKIAFADSSLPVTRINQWKWSWGDGTPSTVFTTHSSPVYHTFANPGTYLVTLQVRASVNGVVIFDNRSDSIKIQPTPKTLFSNLPVCLNQITLFRDTSNTYGESISKRRWNFTTNPADTSGLSNPPYQYDTVGIYNVKLFVTNRFGCKDSLVKPTRVYGLPVANYETSAACSGETAIFTDKSVKADTTLGFWRWFFGDPASSKDSSNLKNPGHRYTATGDYSIRMIAKDHFGCIDTIDSTLTVRETPVAAFTITENINGMPGKILLNNESSSKSYYLWDFGNGKISDLEENPIVQYENDGIFTIRLVVKDSSDCADTTSMKYEFIFGNLYVPNAFSPTSLVSTATGIEIRTFFPKGLNLMAYHAMVFDKWGHLVWESAKLDCDESPSNCKGSPVESWDGTFNGQPMPQDVYMWK